MTLGLYPRAVDRVVADELLPTFPAVMLVGPRGSGKSTSMTALADTVLDLSLPGVRLAAREDPDAILSSSVGTVLIDEWQEAPEILGAVKRAIDQDRDNTPGRFIVTGSVRATLQAATWPGTGRLIRIRMYGLTQAELAGDSTYNPVDALFAATPPVFGQSMQTRRDYLEMITAGRFPSLIGLEGRSRARWLQAYVDQLVDRDAQQVASQSSTPAKLRAVLTSCAARTGQELNKSATAKDAGVDFRTADRAVGLLEDLSIIQRIPAWHTQRLKRLTQAPKVVLSDPGMAAYLLGVDADALSRAPGLIGQMFETFVIAELATHVETASEETGLFHLRDRDGKEVDVVLERRGRIVALEVKSSTRVDRSDAKGLFWLRDRAEESFHFGAVLYSGSLPFQIDDRIWALPISSLWREPES